MTSFRPPERGEGESKDLNSTARMTAADLHEKITSRNALIGVIGLGYVGLPLALTFAEAGFRVLGFDIDPEKIDTLSRGDCYIGHIDSARVGAELASARFSATSDFARLSEPDALIICVPTPLTEDKQPDLSYVESTTTAIADTLRPGQLTVLESTTYPGTTQEVLLPALEGSGLSCGQDFFLAYSPEREDPGNPNLSIRSTPKVVGGIDVNSGDLAEALYSTIVPEVVRVSSTAVAEAAKITENVFRAVNIALVNELKMAYQAMGIDIWDVLDAADTKPFGFMRFNPGPGWGGHCIPVDPFYLAWKAEQSGASARFIRLAGEVNEAMPGYVLSKLEHALGGQGKRLAEARILIVGIAYKKDVDDPRESPAFEILKRLLAAGAEVAYHDPHVPRMPRMRTWPELPRMESVRMTGEILESFDALVLVTDHTSLDRDLILNNARLIVDTRGMLRDLPADDQLTKA